MIAVYASDDCVSLLLDAIIGYLFIYLDIFSHRCLSCDLLYVLISIALEWSQTFVISLYLYLFSDFSPHLRKPLRAGPNDVLHIQLIYLLIFCRRAILDCIAYLWLCLYAVALRRCIVWKIGLYFITR